MPNNDVLPFPNDIPWRLIARGVLDPATAAVALAPPNPVFSPVPSVAVFASPIQRSESKDSYPQGRIAVVKFVISLTGLDVVDGDFIDYAPCIGALLGAQFAYGTAAGTVSQDGVYVRDMFPRRQEMVVNELIGQETLERQSSKVATTKSWNVNAAAAGTLFGLVSLSVSGGVSESESRESARERSERNSRETEIRNVNHVIMGYGLGLPALALTIQPRPFEGESWELVRGFRLIEGIQDCLAVVTVPFDAKYLLVWADLTIGFRGSWHVPRDYRWVPGAPYPPNYTRFSLETVPSDYDDRNWAGWATEYRAYRDMLSYYESQFRFPIVITTDVGASGGAVLYWGEDPCAGESEPDPCGDVGAGVLAEGEMLGGLVGNLPLQKGGRFHELPIDAAVPSQLPFQRSAANSHMERMFGAVRRAASRRLGEGRALKDLRASRDVMKKRLAGMPPWDPRNTGFGKNAQGGQGLGESGGAAET